MEINATLLLQLALFLLLLAWLSSFLFSPFLRLYEERDRRIEGAAAEAKHLRAGADEKAGLIEARMREAQDEARKILHELRENAQARERQIVEEARRKAQARLEDARADLFALTDEVRGKLKDDAQALADDIVAKVLKRAA